jgi:hypothetical protein
MGIATNETVFFKTIMIRICAYKQIIQGDRLLEYDIAGTGINAFELTKETARTIGGINGQDRVR